MVVLPQPEGPHKNKRFCILHPPSFTDHYTRAVRESKGSGVFGPKVKKNQKQTFQRPPDGV
jgi:hypothetical protein